MPPSVLNISHPEENGPVLFIALWFWRFWGPPNIIGSREGQPVQGDSDSDSEICVLSFKKLALFSATKYELEGGIVQTTASDTRPMRDQGQSHPPVYTKNDWVTTTWNWSRNITSGNLPTVDVSLSKASSSFVPRICPPICQRHRLEEGNHGFVCQ